MADAENESSGVDPEEFLRALLKISPEDAAEVREEAARKMKRDARREDPSSDDGNSDK